MEAMGLTVRNYVAEAPKTRFPSRRSKTFKKQKSILTRCKEVLHHVIQKHEVDTDNGTSIGHALIADAGTARGKGKSIRKRLLVITTDFEDWDAVIYDSGEENMPKTYNVNGVEYKLLGHYSDDHVQFECDDQEVESYFNLEKKGEEVDVTFFDNVKRKAQLALEKERKDKKEAKKHRRQLVATSSATEAPAAATDIVSEAAMEGMLREVEKVDNDEEEQKAQAKKEKLKAKKKAYEARKKAAKQAADAADEDHDYHVPHNARQHSDGKWHFTPASWEQQPAASTQTERREAAREAFARRQVCGVTSSHTHQCGYVNPDHRPCTHELRIYLADSSNPSQSHCEHGDEGCEGAAGDDDALEATDADEDEDDGGEEGDEDGDDNGDDDDDDDEETSKGPGYWRVIHASEEYGSAKRVMDEIRRDNRAARVIVGTPEDFGLPPQE